MFSPFSEEGKAQLADRVKPEDPELADFLTDSRFVDDLNDSLKDIASAQRLREAVDEAFAKLGAKIKGWAISGQAPAPEISEDGLVGVAGNAWHPLTDTLELKLQPLHFGRTVRGRLAPDTKTFSGDTTTDRDMNNFVPKFLTRRQITSKHVGVFDIKGLLIPLTARCKRDLRDTFTETPKWDHSVFSGSRAKWVRNFQTVQRNEVQQATNAH